MKTPFSEIHIDISETKERVTGIENTLPGIQERAYVHSQALRKQGDKLENIEEKIETHNKRFLFLEQRYVSISTNNTWGHFEYPRDSCFQTRAQLWARLESSFATSKPAPVILSGSGGMGKTSIASEWACTQKANGRYPIVRWVNMDTSQQQISLESWARALYLPYEKKSVSELWRMIAENIAEQSWLVVFDNVENYAAIQEGLSRFHLKAGQDILITSRDAST